MKRIPIRRPLVPMLLAFLPACAAGPASGPSPEVPATFTALPDTLVCVVDRAAPTGLRELQAKKDGDNVVLFSGGEVVGLDAVHPVSVIAGYAGRENWLSSGDPIAFGSGRYSNVGGERRVASELLDRVGEHRGILLFAGANDDPPPDALYVPTAPGCIFQPFVREDLIGR